MVQCVPLNLVDVKVFWHRLGCAPGEWTSGRTSLPPLALFFTRKSKHLRRKPKLANRAHVDQTMLYRLIIHNVQPGQRATGPLARSECNAPVLRAGPQYGSVPRSREHTAPPRSTPPLWRPRSTVGCSATIMPALGSTAVQQSACREPTERVSRAPGRLSVSAGIARMGRETQNR